jgi:hypothetical protein
MFDNRETIAHMPIGPSLVDRKQDWSLVDLSADARVARGLLYIQRAYPDALSKLDIDAIDITDGQYCVLGQIHGAYDDSPEANQWSPEMKQAHGILPMARDELDEELMEWDLNVKWRHALAGWRDMG